MNIFQFLLNIKYWYIPQKYKNAQQLSLLPRKTRYALSHHFGKTEPMHSAYATYQNSCFWVSKQQKCVQMFIKTQLIECHSSTIHSCPQKEPVQMSMKTRINKSTHGIPEQGYTQLEWEWMHWLQVHTPYEWISQIKYCTKEFRKKRTRILLLQ